jgi:hypothetical protein
MEVNRLPEPSFEDIALSKKYTVTPATKLQVSEGIDYVLGGIYRSSQKEVKMLFAVKRKKSKKKSRYLDRWTWIEYKNSSTKDGWIYGPAHFIAFERSKDFIIVNRKVLLDFLNSSNCKVQWDLPFVKEPKLAKYRVFFNKNTGCKIAQILSKDILGLTGVQVWKKTLI